MAERETGVAGLVLGRPRVSAYTIPTDAPEADGTIEWDATTIVVVEISAGETTGLGYAYANLAAATLIDSLLARVVEGGDPMAVAANWSAMVRAVRNAGRPGIGSMAIAALDIALWDLKARLLDVSVATLLGPVRSGVALYGSGGFTSYSDERLMEQLAGWVQEGIGAVKMKVGARPDEDGRRVAAAREAIGPDAELFIDANGAWSPAQAVAQAHALAVHGVTWLEEPLSSDDLDGLRRIRDQAPPGMAIAAGEYGHDAAYFRRMLAAQAVDVLQADATRCGGITGFLQAGVLADAHGIPLSAHTAPAIHAHAGCAVQRFAHCEYFHDHVRLERLLFDGALEPIGGELSPDLARPGLGLDLKRSDAQAYAA